MKATTINFTDVGVEDIYLLGDIHGNLQYVKYKINTLDLHDCLIIICGDVGLGFSPKSELSQIQFLNKKILKPRNVYVVAVRGNHDDPSLFVDTTIKTHWINVCDYTVLQVQETNILCIGGATSIDRTWRMQNKIGYWPEEKVQYCPPVDIPIHVICSHTAPAFCYPLTHDVTVQMFAQDDWTLIEELDEERRLMNTIYEDYKDTLTHWYYGHFHDPHIEYVDNKKFTLLGIEQLAQHYG